MDPLLVFQKAGDDMHQMLTAIERLVHRDEGQDLIEYGLLVALIALVVVGSVTATGKAVFDIFWQNIGSAV